MAACPATADPWQGGDTPPPTCTCAHDADHAGMHRCPTCGWSW